MNAYQELKESLSGVKPIKENPDTWLRQKLRVFLSQLSSTETDKDRISAIRKYKI